MKGTHGTRLVATRWLLVAALSPLGCTSEPDVVAVGTLAVQRDGGFLEVPLIEGCKAGHYQGIAYSDPSVGDGGLPIAFNARIDFSLVLRPSGEFLVLSENSTLTGVDDTSQAKLSSDIVQGECRDGEVTSTLVDGEYVTPTFTVGFDGEIEGKYLPADDSFVGTWTARLKLLADPFPKVTGRWFAGPAGL